MNISLFLKSVLSSDNFDISFRITYYNQIDRKKSRLVEGSSETKNGFIGSIETTARKGRQVFSRLTAIDDIDIFSSHKASLLSLAVS